MILSDNGDAEPIRDNSVISEQEGSEPAIIRFTRLFRRDIWCWVGAVRKMWWLFAIFPQV